MTRVPLHISTWKHNPVINDDMLAAVLLYVTPTSKVIDVGAGDGFYAKLIKHFVPLTHITGIELTSEYVSLFELKSLYNELIVGDIFNEIDTLSGDIIIFGDVLEHLEKDRALTVLDKAVSKFKVIIVNGPVGFQPQEHENPAEHHRCGLDKTDFDKYTPVTYKEYCNGAMMHCVIERETK